MYESAAQAVIVSVNWVRLGIEAVGALIIAIGILVALFHLVRGVVGRDAPGFMRARLTLARFLVMGLEFQLAADILSTAIAPSWDLIGKLAAIAVIRTGLNYFLQRELREAGEQQRVS